MKNTFIVTEKNKEKIKSILEMELLKRGFNVNLTLTDSQNRYGDYRLNVESNKFQTTPVLFKEIYIHNFNGGNLMTACTIKGEVIESMRDISYNINARYTTFDNGSNGVDLFSITLRIMNDFDVRMVSIR